MQAAIHNKVKVYNLTSGKSLPQWLAERKANKRSGGPQGDDAHRIELIHDLEFPHCCRCIFRTANGTNLFAAGDYPYRLKCFDVNQLSQKYTFNADMPILSGVPLSADFRKFALRGEGRVLTIHHSAAIVDRLRVPHVQRGLAYNQNNCELLSCGVSSEIFRISLETGCFVESYKSGASEEKGVNSLDLFEGRGLCALGRGDGWVEMWDTRSPRCAAAIQVCGGRHGEASSGTTLSSGLSVGEASAVTQVWTDPRNALIFGCGTDTGHVLVYDMRLARPLTLKDHMNGLPVVKGYFFQQRDASPYVLSADSRSIKIWSKSTGANFTTVEPPAEIFDFVVLRAQHNLAPPYTCDDSGVIAISCDLPRVQVHFIPQLGVAPRWAAFLDQITEELEEKETTVVYEDFKFITKEEMNELGLSATDVSDGKVRPAMHGCFVEHALYRDLKALANPTALQQYELDRHKRRRQEREGERLSKFRRRRSVDVQQDEGGLDNDQGAAAADIRSIATKTPSISAALAADPRFSLALKHNAYAVDTQHPEYAKLLNKVGEQRERTAQRREKYAEEHFRIVRTRSSAEAEEHEQRGSEEEEEANPSLGKEEAKKFLSHRRPMVKRSDDEDNANSAPASLPQRRVTLFEAVSNNTGKQRSTSASALRGARQGSGKSSSSEIINNASSSLFLLNEKSAHDFRKKQRARKLTLEERLGLKSKGGAKR